MRRASCRTAAQRVVQAARSRPPAARCRPRRPPAAAAAPHAQPSSARHVLLHAARPHARPSAARRAKAGTQSSSAVSVRYRPSSISGCTPGSDPAVDLHHQPLADHVSRCSTGRARSAARRAARVSHVAGANRHRPRSAPVAPAAPAPRRPRPRSRRSGRAPSTRSDRARARAAAQVEPVLHLDRADRAPLPPYQRAAAIRSARRQRHAQSGPRPGRCRALPAAAARSRPCAARSVAVGRPAGRSRPTCRPRSNG